MKQVTDHVPNQYMLVRFRANTDQTYKYGWIMKFNSRKPDVKGLGSMKLLKANLTYVTPVIPAQIESIKYGALYNWYAATDPRNICAEGWHIPASTEVEVLLSYEGTSSYSLCEDGEVYWTSPNPATNEMNFNLRGAGGRYDSNELEPSFFGLRELCYFLCSDLDISDNPYMFAYHKEDNNLFLGNIDFSGSDGDDTKNCAASLRFIKNSTTLTHGQTGTYTGNDGKIYRTICIGTQEWIADNLAETKYRDGSDIPIVTDNAAWAALTTGAMCYYDNDINNV